MLRHFWALPAFLRLAVCTQSSFSVHNDLLAFPQYEIVFSQSILSLEHATVLLATSKGSTLRAVYDDDAKIAASDLTTLNPDAHNQHQDPTSSNPHSTSERDTYERLVLQDRPYLCTIPYVPPPTTSNTTASTTAEELEQELARATDNGLELLKGMEENCIYYYGGWWVYSFCYNQGIRQFHPLPPGRAGVPMYPPVEDPSVLSFSLGRFPTTPPATGKSDNLNTNPTLDDASAPPPADDSATVPPPTPESSLQTRGETHYLVQKLAGGTSCDLTGLDRRVEVQFHCNPGSQDKIHMIKETASCVYLMVIHTPRLCNEMAFLPPQEGKAHLITCQEIIAPGESEASWIATKSEEAKALMMQDTNANAANPTSTVKPRTPLVIGGIEVGAQRLVGSTPDLTIHASNIVAAANPFSANNNPASQKPQKFLATLAKSDGKYTSSLGEKEMGRLGLKGTKEELTKWIEEMQRRAGEGVPWRLDVVRIEGEGLQFLGIVGVGAEEGGGEETAEGGKGPKGAKGKAKGSDKTAGGEKGKEVLDQAEEDADDGWIEVEFGDEGYDEAYEYGDDGGDGGVPGDGDEGVGSEEEYI